MDIQRSELVIVRLLDGRGRRLGGSIPRLIRRRHGLLRPPAQARRERSPWARLRLLRVSVLLLLLLLELMMLCVLGRRGRLIPTRKARRLRHPMLLMLMLDLRLLGVSTGGTLLLVDLGWAGRRGLLKRWGTVLLWGRGLPLLLWVLRRRGLLPLLLLRRWSLLLLLWWGWTSEPRPSPSPTAGGTRVQ